jgi:hypothetical protein
MINDFNFFAQASSKLHQAIYDYGWYDEQYRHVPGSRAFEERINFHQKADSLAKLLFDCNLNQYLKKHMYSRKFYQDGVLAYRNFCHYYIDEPLKEGFDYEVIGREI